MLELGAGTGKLTRLLVSRFARVIAVEPAEAMRVTGQQMDRVLGPDRRLVLSGDFVVQPDGRLRRKLTQGGNHLTDPAWSPDSRHLLHEEGYFLGHHFDLAWVTLHGKLTGRVSSFPWSEHSPAWQPHS